jgi:hypothetical protein
MDSIQEVINNFVDLVKDYARMEQYQKKREYQLFLFGISIGLRRRLTPQECRAYHKTRLTVDTILDREDTYAIPHTVRRFSIVTSALRDWLECERWLRPELEARFNYEFWPPPDPSWTLPGYLQNAFIKNIRALAAECGKPLTEDEIAAINERLNFPFSPS